MKNFNITYLFLHFRQAYDDLPENFKDKKPLYFYMDSDKNIWAEDSKLKEAYIYIPPERLQDMQESWTRIK